MTEVTKLSQELESNLATIEQLVFVVRNESDHKDVLEKIRIAKTIKQRAIAYFEESKELANKAHKAICANEKAVTNRCDIIETKGKQAILQHDQFKTAEREKERLRLQAEADEATRRERERLEKQAAKLKTPERKEALLEQAETIIAPLVQVEEPDKRKGESTSKKWKYRVVNVEELDRQYMIPNDKMLSGIATSTKGTIKVKGIEFYPVSSLSVKI